jgi:hypothetical protein
MFKSCFPNSQLAGRPNDAPKRGDGLTVGHAKWIYRALLERFEQRPDKLYIVVTAPPVQDKSLSANARAFNTWLVKEWLRDYGGNNVFVFDFFNVLSGPRNHHRIQDGRVEYVTNRGGNTLHYAMSRDDDHPSPAGNRKATKEFVALLNTFYNQWHATAPEPPPEAEETTAAPALEAQEEPEPAQAAVQSEPVAAEPMDTDMIDNFESSTDKWTRFVDGGKQTSLSFKRDTSVAFQGGASLCIDYKIETESWATCSLVYDGPRSWQHARGITVYLHAEKEDQEVVIVAYQGSPDHLRHFECRVKTDIEAVRGWQRIDIPWAGFQQPPWEGDGSVQFEPGKSLGIAFAFSTAAGERKKGRIWVDNVGFFSQ